MSCSPCRHANPLRRTTKKGIEMAAVHTITFYPVGNGDTEQIVLANERRVLFDFCHRQKGEGEETPEIDLKARLKEELKAAKRDSFDVVAFTHADRDHIQGS